MPQVQLPLFPQGTTQINHELAFARKEEQVVYLIGRLPVFTHAVNDLASFRLFTTQLIVNHTASYGEIGRAFGVPLRTIKRWARRYRERGVEAFFTPAPQRVGSRLTAERVTQVQGLLDEGLSVPQVSEQAGVLGTTLHKAIGSGRLRVLKKRRALGPGRGASQHQKPAQCAGYGSGVGRGDDAGGRTGAGLVGGFGSGGHPSGAGGGCSQRRRVVCLAGAAGLGTAAAQPDAFTLRPGFYPLESIFLTMAFVALTRVPSLDGASTMVWSMLIRLAHLAIGRNLWL